MEESIISRLLSDNDVSTLVSNRIYPGSRPQASALPSIVLNRISGAPVYVFEGESGLAEARLQLDCWGATYSSAKLTARAVIESLSAFVGEIGSQTIRYIMLEAERDLRESGSNAEEYPYRVSLDFIIWFDN